MGYARVGDSALAPSLPQDRCRLGVLDELREIGWEERHSLAPASSGGLVIDGHESLGASRVPEALVSSWLRNGDLPERGEAILGVGAGGVAALAFRLGSVEDETVRDTLAVVESSLEPVVNAVFDRVDRVLSNGEARPYVGPLLPPGRVLWWHRVITVDDESRVPAEHRCSCVTVEVSGHRVLVGDGYTYIVGVPREDVELAVLRGLLLATEDWIAIDVINRRAAALLVAVSEASGTASLAELEALSSESLDFALEVEGVQLRLEERNRYLAVGRRAVWHAARQVWGISDQFSPLAERVATVLQMAERLRGESVSHVDRTRNTLLFTLAFATVFEVLTGLLDFTTGAWPVVLSVTRTAIAAVLLLGVGALAVGLLAASSRPTSPRGAPRRDRTSH